MEQSEPAELEDQGWQALSSGGRAAADFYDRVLDAAVLMLLPGGLVLDDRAEIVTSMSGQPWSTYELQDLRVLQPTADTAVVTYGAVATRDGGLKYSALMSSLYVRRQGGWRLTFHQQTPR